MPNVYALTKPDDAYLTVQIGKELYKIPLTKSLKHSEVRKMARYYQEGNNMAVYDYFCPSSPPIFGRTAKRFERKFVEADGSRRNHAGKTLASFRNREAVLGSDSHHLHQFQGRAAKRLRLEIC